MFDFKALEVRDAMSWMDLPEISPNARLLLKPGDDSNPAYYDAMLRKSGTRKRLIARRQEVSAEDIAQNRADDRELYPMRVMAGWEGVEDTEGNAVPFSRDACAEFCSKLPGWIFDRVRNYAATPEQFLAEDEIPLPDAPELAENSKSGCDSN